MKQITNGRAGPIHCPLPVVPEKKNTHTQIVRANRGENPIHCLLVSWERRVVSHEQYIYVEIK